MQVEIFSGYVSKVQNSINAWLSKNPTIVVVETTATSCNRVEAAGTVQNVILTVIIIYKGK